MSYPTFNVNVVPTIGTLTVEQKKKLADVYINHSTYQQFHINSVKEGCYPECDNVDSLVQYAFNSIETICKVAIEKMQLNIHDTIESFQTTMNIEFEHCDKEALYYVIDNIIKWSDSSGTNNFVTFKSYFNV